MITNAMIQISPAIAQAILANLAGNQHDPAMVSSTIDFYIGSVSFNVI